MCWRCHCSEAGTGEREQTEMGRGGIQQISEKRAGRLLLKAKPSECRIWEFPSWLSGQQTRLASMKTILGLAQWLKDLALLWLRCRPAAAALNRPLAWEPPYAAGTTLK